MTSPVLNSYILDIDQVKRGFNIFLSRFYPMIPALLELNLIYNNSELLAEELNMLSGDFKDTGRLFKVLNILVKVLFTLEK